MPRHQPRSHRAPSESPTPPPSGTNGADQTPTFAKLISPESEFYRAQSARLACLAAEQKVPADQIADVLQEVWVEAVKHQDEFCGENVEARLATWLGEVFHSKVVDARRRVERTRSRTRSLDSVAERVDDEAAKRASAEGKQRWLDWLAAALRELEEEDPDNCRLLREHFLKGRAIKELAAETGLTVHAIHNRINRSLKKLRKRSPGLRPDGGAAP